MKQLWNKEENDINKATSYPPSTMSGPTLYPNVWIYLCGSRDITGIWYAHEWNEIMIRFSAPEAISRIHWNKAKI